MGDSERTPIIRTETDCNCIHTMNEALEPLNVELGVVFDLSGRSETTVGIEAHYIEKPKRGAPKYPRVVATHCPFCGRRYKIPGL